MIITIDGPVATGKSTIAKKLSEELGFIFFDTGAMYRAITCIALEKGIDVDNVQAMEEFLKVFDFDIKVMRGSKRYFVGDEDVTEKLRSPIVTASVSKVAAQSCVREKLTAIQRKLAVGVNAVFEGRDMGSVVFPNANLKIFLTGRPEVRAKRRYEEILRDRPQDAAGLTLDQVLEGLNQRDAYDSARKLSPLKQAPDAFVVDTSDLTVDEIVLEILEYKDTLKSRKP